MWQGAKYSIVRADWRNKMIQLIEKKGYSWHMIINGIECVFMPMNLYKGDNLFPEKADCEKGLRWRINRKWVSYNQIKKAIKK